MVNDYQNAQISVKNLSYQVNGKAILRNISLEFGAGEIVGILGPNGAGKTSLLKLMMRELSKSAGDVYLHNTRLENYPKKELAKEFTYVTVAKPLDFNFTVYEIVAMGRYPYLKNFCFLSEKDTLAVDKVIKETKLHDYKHNFFNTLSQGEMQRVMIAKALAQETKFLFLDEPIAHLDIKHQKEIIDILQTRKTQYQQGIVVVSHDINLLARICDRVVLLKDGAVYKVGKTAEVMNKGDLERVFETEILASPPQLRCKD